VTALLLAERDAAGVRASVVPSSSSAASPQRLSHYDQTGLIWLLRGRPVVAFTTGAAAIENATCAITLYRRYL
jgi:hypothetical protein